MTAVALASAMRRGANDDLATDRLYEQYYTCPVVATACLDTVGIYFDLSKFQLVEPSAGDGSFLNQMPYDTLAYDIDPKCVGIVTADFLTVELPNDREVAIIGNPPFKQAVRFFNHAAQLSSFIALILPRTFRKASIQKRLDRSFHLIHDEDMPADAFLFRGKPFNVPATFQIWERRGYERNIPQFETRHPDFEFTDPAHANFCIQRVGTDAGRVHHDFHMSLSSTHFIRGNVEDIMRRIDLKSVARNVAGPPSISKSEIVSLYRQYVGSTAPSALPSRIASSRP